MFICSRCYHLLDTEAPICPRCGLARPIGGFAREEHLGRVVLGRYELVQRLGAGATGAVYLARHVQDGPSLSALWPEQAAVKLLHARFAEDRLLGLRFRREALAASQVESPYVARTIAYGELANGGAFLVMELVEGQGLDVVLQQHRLLPIAQAVDYACDVAHALEAAHQVGVIHRDLKPSNVVLVNTSDGGRFAKVLDFGYARILSPERAVKLTEAGIVVGTPTYMSPEQTARESHVDARTDLYALGALLYRMLAGRPPFEAETIMDLIWMHREKAAPPLSQVVPSRAIPEPLEAVVMRLLAKDPGDRPGSAREVRQSLAPFGSHPVSTPADVADTARSAALTADPAGVWAGRRIRLIAGALLALVILCGLVVLWHS